MDLHLGVDVGSVTTKFALLDDSHDMVADLYTRTEGKPVQVVQMGLERLAGKVPSGSGHGFYNFLTNLLGQPGKLS